MLTLKQRISRKKMSISAKQRWARDKPVHRCICGYSSNRDYNLKVHMEKCRTVNAVDNNPDYKQQQLEL